MVNKKRQYFNEHTLSLLQQKFALIAMYKGAKVSIDKGVLWWYGEARPSPLSRIYSVIIKYDGSDDPVTWVVGSELRNLKHEDFPHKYDIKPEENIVRLCLFLPGAREWTKQKAIANTVVPWAIEWLYFYEVWLATGVWYGGGQHPEISSSKTLQMSE